MVKTSSTMRSNSSSFVGSSVGNARVGGHVLRLLVWGLAGVALMFIGRRFTFWKERRAQERAAQEPSTTPDAPDGMVSGRVLGPDGHPVAAADVRVLDSTGTQVAHGTTAADGGYRIDGVPPGTHRIEISVRHTGTTPFTVAPAGGSRHVTMMLGQRADDSPIVLGAAQ